MSKVRQRLRNSWRFSGNFLILSSAMVKKSLILRTNGSLINVFIWASRSPPFGYWGRSSGTTMPPPSAWINYCCIFVTYGNRTRYKYVSGGLRRVFFINILSWPSWIFSQIRWLDQWFSVRFQLRKRYMPLNAWFSQNREFKEIFQQNSHYFKTQNPIVIMVSKYHLLSYVLISLVEIVLCQNQSIINIHLLLLLYY